MKHILLAEPLLDEFGALFKGLTQQDVDHLLQSFKFEQNRQRLELAKILAEFAHK